MSRSRRSFLATAGAVAAGLATGTVVVSCASDDATDLANTSDVAGLGPVVLRNGFPDGLAQGPSIIADSGTQRAIFSLSRDSAVLPTDELPTSLEGVLTNAQGKSRTVTLAVRSSQIPRHYLSLLFEPSDVGLYTLALSFEDEMLETQFVVAPIADVPLAHPGRPMPPLETPTITNPRGVDPICTRDPMCAFHTMTVADALDAGRPFALMVSTPAFCTSGICGPTLEILINAAPDHPDLDFIHAEVYTHPDRLGSEPIDDLIAPTLIELGMTFEPSLIVVAADGLVRSRLDASMDQVDIAAALDSATI